jgi:dihydroorotase
LTRDSVLAGGLRPHNYCLPIPKGVADRLAIRKAATSGNRKFFFGSDSAPHPDKKKVSTLGKAGIFNAANALSCLAAVFEQEGKLEQLEAFVSLNGSAFYGVSPNLQTITLRRSEKPLSLLAKIRVGGDTITVFGPEEVPLYWYVAA